jgi:hypothetical protein
VNLRKQKIITISGIVCLNAAILTAVQALIFIFTHDLIFDLVKQQRGFIKRDLSWGLWVRDSVWILAFLGFVGTLIGRLIFQRHKIAVQVFNFLIFTSLCFQFLDDRPYRTLLLIFSSFIALLLPFLILQKAFQEKEKWAFC